MPSLRSIAVLQRNFLVWRKTALPTLLGDVLDPIVALFALGLGLGAMLSGVEGVSYLTFLSAGSVCVGTLYGATFESTYSAFSRLQMQRTWDAILNTPLELDDVVWAEIGWATAKAMKSGISILLVVIALDISRAATMIWVPFILLLAGLVFATIGMIVSAFARGYDFFTYYFTLVITPMVYLSGVFFPMDQLSPSFVAVLQWLPLVPVVNLVRPLMLGQTPLHLWAELIQLAVTGGGGWPAGSPLRSCGAGSYVKSWSHTGFRDSFWRLGWARHWALGCAGYWQCG
jgi:lipooligosaccharide transport system permease protein